MIQILLILITTSVFAQKAKVKPEEEMFAAAEFEKSLVHLSVSKSKINTESPWSVDTEKSKEFGIVVQNKWILVSARAILGATYIDVSRFGQSQSVEAKVKFLDRERGLALLSMEDEAFRSGLVSIDVGEDLPMSTEAWLLYGKSKGQIVRSPSRIQEVTMMRAQTSFYQVPHYLIRAQQKRLGHGEAIVRGKNLVGMAIGQDDENLYAVTAGVIKAFLDQVLGGKEPVAASLGIEYENLTSTYMRQLLKIPAEETGVLITKVYDQIPEQLPFQNDDILISIQNQKIDDHGMIRHPLWGLIPFRSLYATKLPGELLELVILRGGEKKSLTVPLKKYDSLAFLVPMNSGKEQNNHLIVGGLLFQELDFSFLESFGRDFIKKAPTELLNLWFFENGPRSNNDRVVVMNRVLADIFNQGYEKNEHLILDQVNDKPCRSLTDLKTLIQSSPLVVNGKKFVKFNFLLGGGEIVFMLDEMDKAHERIAKSYNISSKESFYSIKGK